MSTDCYSTLIPLLNQLTPDRRQAVFDFVAALLQEQNESASPLTAPDAGGPAAGKRPARGWVEIKQINGHPYAYRRWREGKILKSEYVGKVV